MASIIIEPIGEFKQQLPYQTNYETEHSICVPCLDGNKVSFAFDYCKDDVDFLSDAKAIIDEFLALTIQDRNKISQYVAQNCQEFFRSH